MEHVPFVRIGIGERASGLGVWVGLGYAAGRVNQSIGYSKNSRKLGRQCSTSCFTKVWDLVPTTNARCKIEAFGTAPWCLIPQDDEAHHFEILLKIKFHSA
jgi:hypothetical protein